MATLEPNRNVYVGHRYVPKIMGEWDKTIDYEGLSIVTYQGTSYTSKQRVPVGIEIINEEYWVETGNYNIQVEEYRQETKAVLNSFNNYKELNDEEISKLMGRTKLSPDDFEGTDIEKLQAAFDYAVENDINNIVLNRTYDVTGGSIFYKTDSYFDFAHLIISGGKIVKNDEGYVFDCLANNNSRNAPIFKDTTFETRINNVYLFNGNKIIRQNMDKCHFVRMGLVKTDSYLQSVRLIDCETGYLGCDFISAKMAFDFYSNGHKAETSSTGYALFNIQTNKTNDISYFGLRILNILAEGYSVPPIQLGTGYGFEITGYFEANYTSIKFTRGVGTPRISGSLHDLTFGATKTDYDIEFDGVSSDTAYIVFDTITSNIPSGKYLTNKNNVYQEHKNIHLYGGGKFANSTFELKRTKNYPIVQVDKGAAGTSFEITLQNKNQGALYNQTNKQFLLNVMFNYNNSVHYSGHLTGILSIDGHLNEGVINSELNLDVISERNTSGNTNGLLTNTPNFDYYFKETGTKFILPNTTTITIVIDLPKALYANNNLNKCSIKPLNDILIESFMNS